MTKHPATYSARNFRLLCNRLAEKDAAFAPIIKEFGYPELHNIRPNTFRTLVHFILEQQVSMASALSALSKLEEKTGGITPDNVLRLSEKDLRESFLSRQKAGYIIGLARSVVNGTLDISALETMTDEEVRTQLIKEKGIGHWTVDVYLMFVLRRTDILPLGDLAIARSVIRLKDLPETAEKSLLIEATDNWQPYRSIASILLWHWTNSLRLAAR